MPNIKYRGEKGKHIIDSILERLANGEMLKTICREDGMPSFRAFYNMIDSDKELAARYKKAREVGYDAIAEECLNIADDDSGDSAGRVSTDRSKLKVWARLQLLSKWAPQKYGDKVLAEVAGKNGSPVLVRFAREDEVNND